MANVKNFGLVGVGADLQLGKAGTRLINNAGTFNFKAANGTADAALTAAGITSSGNVTLTTGNLALSALNGVMSIGGTNVMQRHISGIPQISSDAAVVLPAGGTAFRPETGAAGMVRINTDVPSAAYVEFFNGTAWSQLATGGSTGALQSEIDAIEASLGTGINANGTFNQAGFDDTAALSNPTSFTDAINQIANYASGHDTLEEILAPGTAGNVIYSNGTTWVQAAPGATSGVQAYDAGLAALAAKTSTGLMVQTGDDTFTSVALVAPAAGITIINADGVGGAPTFALANDLAALEGLATIGYMVRTGDGTATTRSMSTVATDLVITGAADGVSTDTTFGLATVTQADTGNFVKVTLDTKGRVTGNTAVVAADITALVDGTYVNVAGDTMTGNLDFGGTQKVTGLAAPTAAGDAANKAYVDALAAGLSWKQAVRVATVANVALVGAPGTIDGVTLVTGDRVLVKSQTAAAENGIYVFNGTDLVRSADMDAAAEFAGATLFVTEGATNADTGWTQTAEVATLGSTSVTFAQFSGSATYTWGDGLSQSGNTISVNMGAGITVLPGDEVGLDIETGKAVQLTSTATGGQLTLVLAANSGLSQSAAGLTIAPGSVTNSMLATPAFTINADAGTDSLVLGDTLEVRGVSTQGITTSVTESPVGTSTFTVTAANASASQKGVASFTAGQFVVTSGNVALGTVPNANLANSTITFTGDTGSEAVALGESFDFNGDSTFITTAVSGNVVSLTLGTVDVAHGGTGLTTVAANQVLFGGASNTVAQDVDFAFDSATNTLTVGSATIQGGTTDVTITATGTNGDINLVPNGTGAVIIGPSGAGEIESEAGQSLTITGSTVLTLSSLGGDVVLSVANNTTDKVTVAGPSATDYATNLADADLVNKLYVDTAIQSGAASGSVKAVKATVDLGATGTTNIGAVLPAGATILRVKVQVTAAGAATALLQVGKTGLVGGYMSDAENDPSGAGMYISETYVVEGAAVQVIATVSGTVTTGSANVIVEYQVA